eukprot:scaffold46234_cov38-Phaeocystis_antarctica.AAC.1
MLPSYHPFRELCPEELSQARPMLPSYHPCQARPMLPSYHPFRELCADELSQARPLLPSYHPFRELCPEELSQATILTNPNPTHVLCERSPLHTRTHPWHPAYRRSQSTC